MPTKTSFARVAMIAAVFALPACSLLGGSKEPPQQFAPMAQVTPDAAWPRVDAQLTIAPVQIARPYDSLRIAVRPTPQELQVYKGSVWAQRPSDMLTNSLLRTFEESGKLRAVARAGSGVNGDYRLLIDVRRFEADYAGGATPNATIEVSAKLLRPDATDVIASRTFSVAEPVSSTAVPQVVDAFDRAMIKLDRDVVGWTLVTMSGGR
ncbi:ABC-type transport auxiliary lipoprotein family protein [Lysobacter claricitrinus]|uniref:ABC-type transport auxiliary lipoprotein family protein n=1 Tax=Lysobacter claricitrinus TaxID=3367728 RepID=UPI0038B2FBF9